METTQLDAISRQPSPMSTIHHGLKNLTLTTGELRLDERVSYRTVFNNLSLEIKQQIFRAFYTGCYLGGINSWNEKNRKPDRLNDAKYLAPTQVCRLWRRECDMIIYTHATISATIHPYAWNNLPNHLNDAAAPFRCVSPWLDISRIRHILITELGAYQYLRSVLPRDSKAAFPALRTLTLVPNSILRRHSNWYFRLVAETAHNTLAIRPWMRFYVILRALRPKNGVAVAKALMKFRVDGDGRIERAYIKLPGGTRLREIQALNKSTLETAFKLPETTVVHRIDE